MSGHTPRSLPSSALPPPDASTAAVGPGFVVGVGQAPVRPTWAIVAAAIALAGVIAAAVGSGIGFAVAASSASSCSPSDGWCDLGAALVGLAAGVLTATIAYLIVGIITIRRFRPKGHRAGPITAHIVAPPLLFITLSIVSAIVNELLA